MAAQNNLYLAGAVMQTVYEAQYPWPLGSRAATEPDMLGPAHTAFDDSWRAARVRLQPEDFPVDDAIRESFRDLTGRDMTDAEFREWSEDNDERKAAVRANDERTAEAWSNGPQTTPYWPPIEPLPYWTKNLNDIARPQRRWVLCFPDLRSLALALGPEMGPGEPCSFLPAEGPARNDYLAAVRFVQVTWIDDARYPSFDQPASKSEWAFEAMKALATCAPKMHANLQIRIYFLPHRDKRMAILNLDSPGIYHLRHVRAKRIFFQRLPNVLSANGPERQQMDPTLLRNIKAEVERGLPFHITGLELTDRTAIRLAPSFGTIDSYALIGRNGMRLPAAVTRERQLAFLEKKYNSEHHRRSRGRRWFSYYTRKARKRHQDAVRRGAPAAEIDEAQEDLDEMELAMAQLDRHWDSRDLRTRLAVLRDKPRPHRLPYQIYPEYISMPRA